MFEVITTKTPGQVGIPNRKNWDSRVACEEEEAYDAEVFLKFLQKVLKFYPTGKIVMILDNARIHHAKLLEPFLGENRDRLQLVFLPPYSPKLNLIEGLWGWLKDEVICNVFFPAVYENTYMEEYRNGQALALYEITENMFKDEFTKVYSNNIQLIRRYSEYQMKKLFDIITDKYLKKNNLSDEDMENLIHKL